MSRLLDNDYERVKPLGEAIFGKVNWIKFRKDTVAQNIVDLKSHAEYLVKKHPASAERDFDMFVKTIKDANIKAAKKLEPKIPDDMIRQLNYEIDFAAKGIKRDYGW